jgi:hypothetical protein
VAEEPAFACAHCGGPNPAYALNCQWCGSSLASSPLPTSTPDPQIQFDRPVSRSEAFSLDEGPYRDGPTSSARLAAAVIVILIVIAIAVAWAYEAPASPSQGTPLPSGPSYPVNVTVIQLTSPSDTCGLNGSTEPGFHGVTNAVSGETWHFFGPVGGCLISTFTAVTGGFQVLTVDNDQSIPAGQTVAMSVSFFMDGLGGPYTGPLVVSVG